MRFCVLLLLAASVFGNPPRVIDLGTRFVPGYQNQYSELVARILRSRGLRVYSVYDIAALRRSSLSQGGVYFGDSPIGSGLDSTFVRSSTLPGGSSLTYQELYSGPDYDGPFAAPVGPDYVVPAGLRPAFVGPAGSGPNVAAPPGYPRDLDSTFVRSSTSGIGPSIGYEELYRGVDVSGPSAAPIPFDSGSDIGPVDGPGLGPAGPGGPLGSNGPGSGDFSLPTELVGSGSGLSGGGSLPVGPSSSAAAGLSDSDAGSDFFPTSSSSRVGNLVPYSGFSSSTTAYSDFPGPYTSGYSDILDEYNPLRSGGSSVYRERFYDSGPRFGGDFSDVGSVAGETGFGSLSGSSSLDYLRGSGSSGLDYLESGDYIPGFSSASVLRRTTGFPSSYSFRRTYRFPRTYYGPQVTTVRRQYSSPGYSYRFSTYGGLDGGREYKPVF
ncbi:spidroin-2-like isoform X2 [Saccostrea echinata]|uniref:spidroin-2-like isoform X2 n=1 Tax=Saccostrea echinata TaxID=191078 RepID=UPI002A83FB8F|nr:spidroin-2-like isoform X2 [Saccostrea echinata]